ncbi:unnamed protein product, partial [marine sediment metagenome]
LLTIVMVGCGTLTTWAEELRQALLLTDGPMVEATLEAAEKNGTLQFRVGSEVRRIPRENLVRWSTPSMVTASSELILVDGSRLMLTEPWAGELSLKIEAQDVSATTKRLGKITFPRTKLRAVLFNAPIHVQQRTKFVDHLLASHSNGDLLMLANQDVLKGKLLRIVSAPQTDSDNQPGATIIFETEIGKLKFPQTRIAGIVCNPGPRDPSPTALAVGLLDGS